MGDLRGAIDDYTKAIALAPDDAAAYNGRGAARFRLGQYQTATQDFTTALRLNPTFAAAFVQRGDLYRDLGFYEHALADYQSAIRAEPRSSRGYHSVGWLLATCPDQRLRNPEESLRALATAQELDGAAPPATLDAIAAAYAAAGDFNQATKFVEQAIFTAPADEAATYQARLVLYQQNQPFRIAPVQTQPSGTPSPATSPQR
jgi:tetratricopeptide (TPR) repeat protein